MFVQDWVMLVLQMCSKFEPSFCSEFALRTRVNLAGRGGGRSGGGLESGENLSGDGGRGGLLQAGRGGLPQTGRGGLFRAGRGRTGLGRLTHVVGHNLHHKLQVRQEITRQYRWTHIQN